MVIRALSSLSSAFVLSIRLSQSRCFDLCLPSFALVSPRSRRPSRHTPSPPIPCLFSQPSPPLSSSLHALRPRRYGNKTSSVPPLLRSDLRWHPVVAQTRRAHKCPPSSPAQTVRSQNQSSLICPLVPSATVRRTKANSQETAARRIICCRQRRERLPARVRSSAVFQHLVHSKHI